MKLSKRLESVARAALEPSPLSPDERIMIGLGNAGFRGSYDESRKTMVAYHQVVNRWLELRRDELSPAVERRRIAQLKRHPRATANNAEQYAKR